MKLRLTIRVMLAAFSLLLGQRSAEGSIFSFSGSDEGGTASGTMEFLGMGTSLTVKVNNTSPLVLDISSGVNAPGITGFGFDAAEPIPIIQSWELTAFDGTPSLVTIGDSSGTASDWIMTTGTQGIQLDFFPATAGDIKGALYNPLQTTGFAAPPNYFTQAVLTVLFDVDFNLDVHPAGTGGVDASPSLRFQNVGLNGEGSLKLGSNEFPSGPAIPEPASVVIWGLLGTIVVAAGYRRRRES